MGTLGEDREIVVLAEVECLELMGTATIGRMAFTEGALPAVQPVSFALDHDEVFIPTHRGSKVAAASRGAVVAFEVDDVDTRSRTGWNVTVVGPSRLVLDATEVARLDQLGVQSWAGGADGHCYIGIKIRLVQGRRIRRGPVTVDGVSGDLDGRVPAAPAARGTFPGGGPIAEALS